MHFLDQEKYLWHQLPDQRQKMFKFADSKLFILYIVYKTILQKNSLWIAL